jgi:hypothetical protein
VTTDREALAGLLDAIDEAFGPAPIPVRLADAAAAAVRQLQQPPHECVPEVERASRAAYAAGQARNAGANPGGAVPSP